jgi:heme/copper-type cytochrome/quinol oxidase subunit 3
MISTLGAFIMGLAVLIFLGNMAVSYVRGERAGSNPWKAWTLEWATTSPPPHDNFVRVPPVRGRRPLWDLEHGESQKKAGKHDGDATGAPRPLRLFDKATVGMWAFIASEAGFFGILIITFVLFNPSAKAAATYLDLQKTAIFSACLFASSFTLHMGEKAQAGGNHGAFRGWLAATVLLGGVFMAGQGNEYVGLFARGLTINTSLFASTFFTLTGFHGLHVTLGLVALAILLFLAFKGDFKGKTSSALKAAGLYWHFVDVVWIAVFSVVYLRNLL